MVSGKLEYFAKAKATISIQNNSESRRVEVECLINLFIIYFISVDHVKFKEYG